MRLLLLLCTIGGTPRFECASPCVLDAPSNVDVFVRLAPAVPHQLQVRALAPVGVEVAYPLPYAAGIVELNLTTATSTALVAPVAELDALRQLTTFRYHAFELPTGESTIELHATADARARVRFGESRLTPTELLALPVALYQLHGAAWSDASCWWVFAGAAAACVLLQLSAQRQRPWQLLLLLSAAAFLVSAADKLYHAIASLRRVWRVDDVAVVLLCALVDLLPALACFVVHAQGACRPAACAAIGLVTAAGALFVVGAGYFVGPALLALACLCLLAIHFL